MMAERASGARRAAKVIGMTGGVSGSYIGYLVQSLFLDEEQKDAKLRSVHARTARRISDELGMMRGPLMKLGQTLSIQTGLLPEEVVQELATLQMKAPGMHASLVRVQVKASLGDYPESIFRTFDPVPFAAASLGQVHHAVTKGGRKVVVKVQYPDIAAAIRNDFRMLRTVALPAGLSRHIPAGLIDELEQQIQAETDYRREADNITFFRKAFAASPWVEIPEVHAKYSSDRVITMSPLEGVHLEQFLARNPSQQLRYRAGAHIMEMFYLQLLHLGAFHADPHWGNYLFQDNGRIGLLDFGCVKYAPREFVENLRRIFLYPGPRDSAEFRRLLDERYAMQRGQVRRRARESLVEFAQNFYGKVYPPDPATDNVPFDFGNAEVLQDFMRESAKLARSKGVLPDYIFLGRAEAGLYQTLHRLRARVHTSRIVRQYIA
jgi:predicted unusual protein kinase regulating ubiquinone biosynthesis (AarF/ABC1/UbiB family)